jgi:Fe2+ transport system protein FeoA
MLLSDVRCGDVIEIKRLLGDEGILKRIEAMGIRVGATFEVVQRFGRNILIKNGTNRIVVSEDIARSVEVDLIRCGKPWCELGGGCPGRKRRRWGWLKRCLP